WFWGVRPWRPPNYAEPDATDKPAWVQAITWTQQDQQSTDAFRQKQLECLQSVDEAVAAIVQALAARGVLNNTLILYSADNGYSWGSHRWKPKQCEYEECMRDPLIVRYAPLVTKARKEQRITLNIDFAQTFAELAGATPDPGVEGMSLVPLLRNDATTWRSDLLNEHWDGTIPDFAQVRGLFTKPGKPAHIWKYVELASNEKELYNEDTDGFELGNVAGNAGNAALIAIMAARLRALDPGWPETAASATSAPSGGAPRPPGGGVGKPPPPRHEPGGSREEARPAGAAVLLADDPGARRVRPAAPRGGRCGLRRRRPAAGRHGGDVPLPGGRGAGRSPVRAAVRARPRRRGLADRHHSRRSPAALRPRAPRRGAARRGEPDPAHHRRPGRRGARHAPPDLGGAVLQGPEARGEAPCEGFRGGAHPEVPRLARADPRAQPEERRALAGGTESDLRRPVGVPGRGGAALRLSACHGPSRGGRPPPGRAARPGGGAAADRGVPSPAAAGRGPTAGPASRAPPG